MSKHVFDPSKYNKESSNTVNCDGCVNYSDCGEYDMESNVISFVSSIKTLLVFAVLLFLIGFLVYFCFYLDVTELEEGDQTFLGAVVTVPEHVKVDDSLWVCIGSDDVLGLKYYTPSDSERIMHIGSNVILPDGTVGLVNYTDYSGFSVITESHITGGDSGKSIRNLNGDQIATIEKSMPDGSIYCLYTIS